MKKGTYTILFAVLIIFCLVMFLLFGVDNIKKGNREATIILGDNTVWTYKDNKWAHVVNYTSIQKLNWQSYYVFSNNEKVGKFYLWHDDKWYVFDKNKSAVDIDGNLLAYRSNYEMPVFDFTLEEIENKAYIEKVLEENGISTSSFFTVSSQVVFDFDNDGNAEKFYLVSNAFPIDFEPDVIFSVVIMVKDDTIYPIYTDFSENQSFNGCKPFFNTFMDVNNDNNYEVVLSCANYSVSEQLDMLYSFENNEFKLVISN